MIRAWPVFSRQFQVVVFVVSVLASPTLAQTTTPSLDPELKQSIEAVIESYLRSRPEVIEQALQTLAVQRQERETARIKQAIVRSQGDLHHDPTSPVSGDADGDVTVVEFFDYRCGFCKRAASAITQLQHDDARVRVVYKDFPILGTESLVAATAALASQSQGRHQAFHEALLAAKEGLTHDDILRIARDVGLNPEQLQIDMENAEWLSSIHRNQALARELGITGTPAFIVGNELVLGAVDLTVLKTLVARARGR